VTLTPAADSSSHRRSEWTANGNALAIWLHYHVHQWRNIAANLPAAVRGARRYRFRRHVSAQNPVLAVMRLGRSAAVADGEWNNLCGRTPLRVEHAHHHRACGVRRVLRMCHWRSRGCGRRMVVGHDIGSDARSGGCGACQTTSRIEWRRTARVALGPARQRRGSCSTCAVRRCSGYSYPLQAVSHPAGGSWGTPGPSLGKRNCRHRQTSCHSAAPLSRVWVNGASVQSCHRAIVTAHLALQQWLASGGFTELAVAASKTAATWVGPVPPSQVSITTCHKPRLEMRDHRGHLREVTSFFSLSNSRTVSPVQFLTRCGKGVA